MLGWRPYNIRALHLTRHMPIQCLISTINNTVLSAPRYNCMLKNHRAVLQQLIRWQQIISNSCAHTDAEGQDVEVYMKTQCTSTANSCVHVGLTSSPSCSEDASQSVLLLQMTLVQCLLLTSSFTTHSSKLQYTTSVRSHHNPRNF